MQRNRFLLLVLHTARSKCSKPRGETTRVGQLKENWQGKQKLKHMNLKIRCAGHRRRLRLHDLPTHCRHPPLLVLELWLQNCRPPRKAAGSEERRKTFPSWATEDCSILYPMAGHCKERSTRSTNAGEAGGRTKKKSSSSSSRGGHRHSSKLRGVCWPFTYLAQNPRSWNLHNRQDIILTSSKTTGTYRHQLPTPFGIVPGRAAEKIMLCKKGGLLCPFWDGHANFGWV